MNNVKGTLVLAAMRFIDERIGPEGRQAILPELREEDRRLLETGALASAWYPISLLLTLHRLAQKHFGDRFPNIHREIGRAAADYGFTTVYRIFLKVGSPEFILARATSVFAKYYESGTMRVAFSEKGHAICEIAEFADPAPELCDRIAGFLARTIELSGGKDFRQVHPQCVNRGDPLCRFEGWWS